ncbi:MAG: penicillin-binding transpeptidase domain-containing protein [Planctomycetota bacterium]|nr:penicillin-binding transpeptidase domain-containing protein [Planctomycetota bacterium]
MKRLLGAWTRSSSSRLSVLGVVYACGLLVVLGHLLIVMVVDHEDWLVRSYRNRWAFRDVPTVRGTIEDRMGQLIAQDEPVFELSCVYERFRLLHPVGAAVHGATLWSRLSGNEVRFGYRQDAVGPQAAFDVLVAIPVGTLLGDSLGTRREWRNLAQSAVTVLAACSDRTHRRVRRDLRDTAARDPSQPLSGSLADVDPAMLRAQFAGILVRLRELDAALVRVAQARLPASTDPADVAGLLDHLDGFRIDCLNERRTQRRLADGTVREGELMERLARPLLRDLPFALAAALRVAADDQPGLRLEPSLRRLRAPDLPPTLRQLLGRVATLERNPGPPTYLQGRVDAAMTAGLEELVPDNLAPTVEYRRALRSQAARSYARALRNRERRGTSGIESELDEQLVGAPGLRLVERDARSREQLLWSSLQVAPGSDVALTVDLDLQRLLDRQCAGACAFWQQRAAEAGLDAGRVDVAMAVIDARSGDVLALGSAPNEIDGRPRLPAVLSWRGNGTLGSIVKPFFALEQLMAARAGHPHQPLADFAACAGAYRGAGGRTFRCDHAHWDEGKDLVSAVGKSCNTFFFQVGEGLGAPGLRRALYRVGMLAPDFGDGDGRHQDGPHDLPEALVAGARMAGSRPVQMRAIGYGIEANPLSVARAYAALATGMLPTLGLARDEQRPRRALGADPQDLAAVVAGLRFCVDHGTARDLAALQSFSAVGKTGTAEIQQGGEKANNAWFAGFLPPGGAAQLAFCAVVYAVPEGVHGADAAGELVGEVLQRIAADRRLATRYLPGRPSTEASGR